MQLELDPKPLRIKYKNYHGEISIRVILPQIIAWGSSSWHPEPTWLLLAYDTEKQDFRDFAVLNILEILDIENKPT